MSDPRSTPVAGTPKKSLTYEDLAVAAYARKRATGEITAVPAERGPVQTGSFPAAAVRFRRRLIPLAVFTGFSVTMIAPGVLVAASMLTGTAIDLDNSAMLGLFGLALVAGYSLGVAVYIVPMELIRRQERLVERSIRREVEASSALTALNKMLSQKVENAVEEVRALSDKMIDMQENERRRIARELHDGVGQSLAALRFVLDRAASEPAEAGERVAEAQRILDEALLGLRQAVYDLRPPEIGTTPLPDIFQSYCERFELRSRLATSFRWRGDAITSEPVATCLLRILQEAFTNIAKHARASEVGVSVRVGDTMAELLVQDDGVGFDGGHAGAGTGLRGIRERCAFFGGSCQVDSAPGGGTRLRVSIPLRKKIDGLRVT